MVYTFEEGPLPNAFHWFNEPARWQIENGLRIVTDPETDFWQRTHYGFQRDNGHCLLTRVEGNFVLSTATAFEPVSQYDQCGLFVRVDADNWIKASTEYEHEHLSRLGSVVTNLGYSDWATQDLPFRCTAMHYRITREGNDFLLECSEDGTEWRQMRVTHLHHAHNELEAGIYACSPVGPGFECTFKSIALQKSE